MANGPEREAEAKAAQHELATLSISTLTKDELKQRMTKVQKEVMEEIKKKQKAELKTAVSAVVDHFDKNKDDQWAVLHLPISANAKGISEVLNHVKTKDKDRSVYVFGGSSAEGAVVQGVYVGTVRFPVVVLHPSRTVPVALLVLLSYANSLCVSIASLFQGRYF